MGWKLLMLGARSPRLRMGAKIFLRVNNLVGVGPLVADVSFVLVSRKMNQVLKPFFP